MCEAVKQAVGIEIADCESRSCSSVSDK